jgi:uncharacterized protein YwgA
MNRLQLATLLSWAPNARFEGRKRLQKVVFFLQDVGCPLECRFILHFYGPYSHDVADRCDEMVTAGLIEESGRPTTGGMQYAYTLKPETRKLLQRTRDEQMQPFQAIGADLISQTLWSLELGSTILLFYRQNGDWGHALARACEFKNVRPDIETSQAAFQLAQRIHAQARN